MGKVEPIGQSVLLDTTPLRNSNPGLSATDHGTHGDGADIQQPATPTTGNPVICQASNAVSTPQGKVGGYGLHPWDRHKWSALPSSASYESLPPLSVYHNQHTTALMLRP
ncbi:MAG: hypothetical protein AVDCRST_MAG93-1258 [uncultured Chloroflexia bacterium]|uniref:Uncharacterized protein n=1 Tax=uncultured Chloroflexia bacterium TaxID=1672391 RepID=A0A6J4I3U2_9CHLR|nr:MAG: hypothetical protein AVDCRST_MAG93-1258 [uncultured Chloroflexia bacterium]